MKSHINIEKTQDKSVVTSLRSVKPVRILTPKTHNESCHVVFSNYGGGFVGDDTIQVDIKLDGGTKTLLSTQANTRIYKTEKGSSSQIVEASIGENAFFVQMNDPLVMHKKSSFLQKSHWLIDRSSVCLFVDWFSAGRSLNGEVFEFDCFDSEFKCETVEKALIWDRFSLEPSVDNCQSPALFNNHSSFVNIFLAGKDSDKKVMLIEKKLNEINHQISQKIGEQAQRLDGCDLIGKGSRINENVYVFRLSGRSTADLAPLVKSVSSVLAEKELLGFDPSERKF